MAFLVGDIVRGMIVERGVVTTDTSLADSCTEDSKWQTELTGAVGALDRGINCLEQAISH